MACYVDNPELTFGRMKMCHLVADSIGELHEMADKLGMKRSWYQCPPKASAPHYDLSKGKREVAIKLGAEISDSLTISVKSKWLLVEWIKENNPDRYEFFRHKAEEWEARMESLRQERIARTPIGVAICHTKKK